jgi:hypothetical protein
MTTGGYVIVAYVAGLLLLWGYGVHLILAARKQIRHIEQHQNGGKSCPSS